MIIWYFPGYLGWSIRGVFRVSGDVSRPAPVESRPKSEMKFFRNFFQVRGSTCTLGHFSEVRLGWFPSCFRSFWPRLWLWPVSIAGTKFPFFKVHVPGPVHLGLGLGVSWSVHFAQHITHALLTHSTWFKCSMATYTCVVQVSTVYSLWVSMLVST